VLLRDADIEVPVRELLRELGEPGASGHGRGDGHEAAVLAGGRVEDFLEDLRVGDLLLLRRRGRWRRRRRLVRRRRGRLPLLALAQEALQGVVLDRVLRGGLVSVPLHRQRVEEDRSLDVLQVAEDLDEPTKVVAIHRTVVVEPELLEEEARHE
jgi:hypothetical protein